MLDGNGVRLHWLTCEHGGRCFLGGNVFGMEIRVGDCSPASSTFCVLLGMMKIRGAETVEGENVFSVFNFGCYGIFTTAKQGVEEYRPAHGDLSWVGLHEV